MSRGIQRVIPFEIFSVLWIPIVSSTIVDIYIYIHIYLYMYVYIYIMYINKYRKILIYVMSRPRESFLIWFMLGMTRTKKNIAHGLKKNIGFHMVS